MFKAVTGIGFFHSTEDCTDLNSRSDVSLSEISAKDKKWDVLKARTDGVSQLLYRAGEFEKWAQRMECCAGMLKFAEVLDKDTGEIRLRLRKADFCHCRHCLVCDWRRQLMYQARFLEFLPSLLKEYPKARWVFMTLTVPNVPVESLREQLKLMNLAWKRLIKRKEFKSVNGWIRTTEVTMEKNRSGYAHPHFHCLMMVPPSWFDGKHYIKQSRWSEIWGECMRLDVIPIVDVRAIKGGPDKAILETIKAFTYSVKSESLISDANWTLEYFKQVHHLRFIATGGALKDALKRIEAETDDEFIHVEGGSSSEENEDKKRLAFNWRKNDMKYRRCKKADEFND